MEDVLIEFRGVTKRFGTRTILNKINLSIYDNQVTTIIGKSGTGKSVLLKHIMGLLEPTEGTILFRGKPTDQMGKKELDEFRNKFSYCFQNNALFDSMTVFENIALPLRQTTKLDKKEIYSFNYFTKDIWKLYNAECKSEDDAKKSVDQTSELLARLKKARGG